MVQCLSKSVEGPWILEPPKVNRRWEKTGWESVFKKTPSESIGQKSLINTRLEQCFSDFNVHMNHLEILLKCILKFSRSGGMRFCVSNKIQGEASIGGL